jgi:hypothetical protein
VGLDLGELGVQFEVLGDQPALVLEHLILIGSLIHLYFIVPINEDHPHADSPTNMTLPLIAD